MPNKKNKIDLARTDKVFYPENNYTKGDVINYYNRISTYQLPHIKNRLLVTQRFPDGIKKSGFYQKETPDYFPSWIKTKRISLKKGGQQKLVIPTKTDDIIYLVNLGGLVFHIWLSAAKQPSQPDKIIFDLDPPPNQDFSLVKFAAYKLKETINKKGLIPFVLTTGSRGLHVVVPIKPRHHFDSIRKFTKQTAQELAKRYPKKLTIAITKKERRGRLFVDYLRNSFGQTGIAPYSLRALPGAPVATPLDWKELTKIDNSQHYNLNNIFRRLGQKKDPWLKFKEQAQEIKL